MATLNEIVYNLKNLIRGGRGTNDSELSTGQVRFIVEYYRARLVREALERKDRLRDFEQELAVPLVLDTSRVRTSTGNMNPVLVSTSTLPKVVRLKSMDGLTGAWTADRSKAIPVVDHFAEQFNSFNRYTKNEHRCFLLNDRLYVFGDPFVVAMLSEDPSCEVPEQSAIVRGVFESPEQVHKFLFPGQLYTGDEPYPAPLDIVQRIVEVVSKVELEMLVRTNPDNTLDGAGK